MSQGYSVIYSPEALDDLRSIYAHIADVLHPTGRAKHRRQDS